MSILQTPKFSIKNICIAGAFIQLLACIFSVGYHNPDEHWQLLEFAAYKLGFAPLQDMAWEVAAKSRQAILPFVVFCFGKIMLWLDIYNPFHLIFFLRLISGILGYSSTMLLIFRLKEEFASEKIFKITLLLANFLWFIPYIHCRFQSENWTGIFLTFAVYFIYPFIKSNAENKNHFWILTFAGFLLGFSFIIRIQTGLAIFGLGIWLLFFSKLKFTHYIYMFTGFLAMLGLGTCVDYWFFGEWVFTPYTYFNLQVVQGISSNWGIYPWWHYFYLFAIQVVPLESLVLLGLFLFAMIKYPKHVLTWILFFFIAGHSSINYKEVRYLYPLVALFVSMIGFGIQHPAFEKFNQKINPKLLSIIIFLLLFQNTIFLIITTLKPANEIVNVQHFIYDEAKKQKVVVYVNGDESPYEWGFMKYNFYKNANVEIRKIHALSEIIVETKSDTKYLFAERKFFLSDDFKSDLVGKSVCKTVPTWLSGYNFNNWISRARVWSVYELTGTK